MVTGCEVDAIAVMGCKAQHPSVSGHQGTYSNAEFSVGIHSAGWYRLTVEARRHRPGITFPAGMLSSRATLDSYCKADPAKPVAAPGFLTRFLPGRAEQPHQPAPKSTTTVAVSAGRGWRRPSGTPAPPGRRP